MLGPHLTNWTIRLALAAYALWLAGGLIAGGKLPSARWLTASRWLYTVGCGLLLAHVACAFHFNHGWSHQAAYDETARQTREVLGFAFGAGIYFNYLFTLLWVADVVWLWIWPSSRLSWLNILVQLYMVFIALNGAIVFEGGVTRWAGLPVAVVLGILAIRHLITPHSAISIPHSR